jgi:multicomponent Na+:H+ antiporter subunit D
MLLPPLALLAVGLGLGLAPGLEAQAASAAASFSDRAVYAAQVLGTHGSVLPPSGAVVAAASGATTLGGVLTDLGQVAVALCVAAIALDQRAGRLRGALAAGTGWLRRLHSGLVGDQVSWLVAGLALLAALSGLALR